MTTKMKKESAPRRYEGPDPYSIVGLEVECRSCNQVMPASAFARNRREVKRFGLRATCRACCKAYQERRKVMPVSAKLKRVPQADRELYAEGRKRCSSCRQALDHDEFGPDRHTWDQLKPYCRTCDAKRLRESYARRRDGIGRYFSADAAAEHALLAVLDLEVGDLEDGAEIIVGDLEDDDLEDGAEIIDMEEEVTA